MICFTVKAKTLLWCGLTMICCAALYMASNGIISVFKVGDREIPIYSVEREDNRLALTFNCAWNDSDVDSIIQTLKKYEVGATFFAVGDWAEKYPEALLEISNAGYEIGNHSYNHAHYNQLSKEAILTDIQKCDDIIKETTHTEPYLFRAAYGEYNNNVVSACDESGRVYIQWSVDSLDYKASSAQEICDRVLKKASAGDIILMHNGTEFTAKALDALLLELTKKYTLVSVSELIYKDHYSIDAAGRQHQVN